MTTVEEVDTLTSKLEIAIERISQLEAMVKKTGDTSFDGLTSGLKKTSTAALKATSDIGALFSSGQAQSAFKDGFKSIIAEADRMRASIVASSADMGTAMAASVELGSAHARASIIKNFGDKSGFNQMQEMLMEVQEGAIQMGVSFGQGFSTAAADGDNFLDTMRNTMSITRENAEAVLSVRDGLKAAFGPHTTKPIEALSGAIGAVGTSLDLTTTAMLISKATGSSNAAITEAMSTAHLRLGMDIEETAAAFGHLRDAAKGSGLEFDGVMKSVMSGASALEFYGAKVETITPLFKRFNESLSGIGKEGLTGDLLNTFIDGLKGMEFGARSLLSLSAPGGASRGAIGGGLAMEAALETGEGMDTIVASLEDTLKKYSGQDILTRKDAMGDPNLEKAYMVQRQTLQSLTKISDVGKLDEVMRMMQGGAGGGADAQASLKELLSAGAATADATTTGLEKAQLDELQSIYKQGGELVDILKKRFAGTEMQAIFKSIDVNFQKAAQNGQGGQTVILESLKDIMSKKEKAIDTYENVGARGGGKSAQLAGRLAAQESNIGMANPLEFQKNIASVMKDMLASNEIKRDDYNKKAKEFSRHGNVGLGRNDAIGDRINRAAIDVTLAPMDKKVAAIDEEILSLKESKDTSNQGRLALLALTTERETLAKMIRNKSRMFETQKDRVFENESGVNLDERRGARASSLGIVGARHETSVSVARAAISTDRPAPMPIPLLPPSGSTQEAVAMKPQEVTVKVLVGVDEEAAKITTRYEIIQSVAQGIKSRGTDLNQAVSAAGRAEKIGNN